MPDKYAMPGGVASMRRFNAAASIIRYLIVMLVWLDRYPPHRLVAGDRLFQRGTRVLELGIDFLLGPNVTLPRESVREVLHSNSERLSSR